MNRYGNIMSSLGFQKTSDNEWELNNVLNNDIINYVTIGGSKDGGLQYHIFKPDEPTAVTYIAVSIDLNSERLSVKFNMGKTGNCTREMPLSLFEDIFTSLLEDSRDSKISKIFNK